LGWIPGRTYRPYLHQLMAHDRFRRLWKEADRPWPQELLTLRGNGKAAADPEGVRAFTDAEIEELRARLQRSTKLTPAVLVAWDLRIVFGLRPAELQGLELNVEEGLSLARVQRVKRSSMGPAERGLFRLSRRQLGHHRGHGHQHRRHHRPRTGVASAAACAG